MIENKHYILLTYLLFWNSDIKISVNNYNSIMRKIREYAKEESRIPAKSWICIWGSFEAGNVSRVSISISEVSAPYLVFAC